MTVCHLNSGPVHCCQPLAPSSSFSARLVNQSRPTVAWVLQTSTCGKGECWCSRGRAARWCMHWGLLESHCKCPSFPSGILGTTAQSWEHPQYMHQEVRGKPCRTHHNECGEPAR